MPGIASQGETDLEGVKALRHSLRSSGIDINRVMLPKLTDEFVENRELRRTCWKISSKRWLSSESRASPRQRVEGDAFN